MEQQHSKHQGSARQLTWPALHPAQVHASLLSLLKGPALRTEELEAGPLLQRLQATPEGLELAAVTNPLLSQMVGQLLFLLRVFSFS